MINEDYEGQYQDGRINSRVIDMGKNRHGPCQKNQQPQDDAKKDEGQEDKYGKGSFPGFDPLFPGSMW